MKRFAASLISATAAILPSSLQAEGPQAGTLIRAAEHRFGTIHDDGGKVSHKFYIVNNGTAPLLITKVTTSCSCTKASYRKAPVAPDDSTALEVTYNPKGQKGFFVSPVVIFSNAPQRKDIVVVTGEVAKR